MSERNLDADMDHGTHRRVYLTDLGATHAELLLSRSLPFTLSHIPPYLTCFSTDIWW